MNQGFILLHRKIRDNVLWPKNKPFTKIEAWLDLLMMARFDKKPIEILLGNEIVICGRGQIVRSINTYQKRWNWGAQRVKSFFDILLKLKQIEKKTTTKTTIITICNYDSYQSEQQTDNKRKTNGKQTDNKRITTKKQRETKLNQSSNKGNNIFTFSDFINLFNSITNRTFKGCDKSKGHFNQRIKKYNGAEFGIAIRNAFNDEYLRQNPKYLTPEYITRENQIEKWLNVIEGEKPKEQTRKKTMYDINNDAYKDPDRLKF